MNRLLLMACALFSFAASAQIHVILSDLAHANDTVRVSTVTPTAVDFSTTGANQNWDFTNLQASGQDLIQFNSMAGVDMITAFQFGPMAPPQNRAHYYMPATDLPIASIGNLLPTIQIKDSYRYFRLTSSSLTSVGLSILTSMGNFPQRSDTVETFYQLPMDFGNQFSSRGYTKMDFNPFFDAKFIQHRERNSEVDGYGSISTPFGSFYALRIHHIIDEVDSFYINYSGFSQWIPIPVPRSHEYEWWAKDQKLPVLKIVTNELAGSETVTKISYRDAFRYDLVASLPENELQIGVYPNPTSGILKIDSPSELQTVSLIDLSGKEFVHKALIHSNSLELNLSDYPKGAYLLYVLCSDGSRNIQQIQIK